jgi:hypothetical protein
MRFLCSWGSAHHPLPESQIAIYNARPLGKVPSGSELLKDFFVTSAPARSMVRPGLADRELGVVCRGFGPTGFGQLRWSGAGEEGLISFRPHPRPGEWAHRPVGLRLAMDERQCGPDLRIGKRAKPTALGGLRPRMVIQAAGSPGRARRAAWGSRDTRAGSPNRDRTSGGSHQAGSGVADARSSRHRWEPGRSQRWLSPSDVAGGTDQGEASERRRGVWRAAGCVSASRRKRNAP